MRLLLCTLLQLYSIVLLAYIVLSWVPRPPEPLRPLARGVQQVVDPVLRPLRRVMPGVPIGGVRLDLSVLVLFIVLSLLQSAVC